MGVLAPLVDQAQPAIVDGGVEAAATEGRTWRWTFIDITDASGDPIDLTSVTGVCKVWTEVGGPVVVSLDVSGLPGEFTVSLDEALTVGLADTATHKGRGCVWGCWLDDGTDEVQIWGPSNSPFVIFQEA